MKKIIFLTSSLMFILSCSNENGDMLTGNENSNLKETISTNNFNEAQVDEMFYEYVNSGEFISTRNAVLNFNLKLKSLPVPGSFATEPEFYSWINDNIEETDFENMSQVHNEWNHVKSLIKIKYNRFTPVREFITTAPVDFVNSKLKQWLPGKIPVTTTDDCTDAYNDCADAAYDIYTLTLQGPSWTETEGERNNRESQAEAMYEFKLKNCFYHYQNCE